MNPERPATGTRLRLRVDDDPELTWEIGLEDVPVHEGLERPMPHAIVELDVTTADRAAGIRRFATTIEGWTFEVSVESASRARLRDRAVQGEITRHGHGPLAVHAPMTGRVVRIWVAEGDTVEAGQRLLAIEAMKMENEVRAPRAGVVASIDASVGDSVEHGDELVTVR